MCNNLNERVESIEDLSECEHFEKYVRIFQIISSKSVYQNPMSGRFALWKRITKFLKIFGHDLIMTSCG